MHWIEGVLTSPVIYLAVLVLALLDAFLPIVPSETVVIAAAVFAVSGIPSLPLIIVLAAVGAFIGDHIGYALGRQMRRRRRLARLADKAGPHLHRRGGALIIAGRFVPGGRTAIVTAGGVTGYPLARFSLFTAIAATVWATYSGLIGYLGGAVFESDPALGLALGAGLALTITGLGELARRLWDRHRARAAAEAGAPALAGAGARGE
ncbi:DedA family protein [Paractinoplanes abujensis]|nr:VTT domain-containing protein [Actinoplanes abujensis]